MVKVPALALALLLASSSQQTTDIPALGAGAEFPPQDSTVWWYQRRGVLERMARRQLAGAPATPETVSLLAQAENLDGMLTALRQIVDAEPRRIADAFEALGDAVWRFRGGDERTQRRKAALQQLAADARRRLPELPREEAARAARVFVTIDSEFSGKRDAHVENLSRFIAEYHGTEAALLAEVDMINAADVSQQTFDALDRFVDAHPRTAAAAKALYLKGSHLDDHTVVGTRAPPGADPTDRFMRVLDIVDELESGRYPKSQWVEKAPSLVFEFFIWDRAYIEPKNIDRLLREYQEFLRTHFVLDIEHPARAGLGYLITHRMADLFERKGERVAGVERMLADLERTVDNPSAVRYLRAAFGMERLHDRNVPGRDALLARTRRTLELLSAEGSSVYHRKALATLAALDFAEQNYTAARAAFRKYVTAYPQSGWAWLAMLRIGQCEEELGNWQAATEVYRQAAGQYGDLPLVRVLGHEYAARAFEALGQYERALAAHEQALESWDNAFGLRYTTDVRRSPKPDDPFIPSRDLAEVRKEALLARIAQLKRSSTMPGGAHVERGRWLLARRRYAEAAAVLERMLRGTRNHPLRQRQPIWQGGLGSSTHSTC